MSTWDEAREHALEECRAEASPAVREMFVADEPRPPISLVVVDHFDLGMIDLGPRGARLLVRPLTRLEALSLVREKPREVQVMTFNERGQSLVERELGLEPALRPRVTYGVRILVVHQVRWNEIRWYLVEYEADGDGCIP